MFGSSQGGYHLESLNDSEELEESTSKVNIFRSASLKSLCYLNDRSEIIPQLVPCSEVSYHSFVPCREVPVSLVERFLIIPLSLVERSLCPL